MIGVVSFGILGLVVQQVDKNKPKNEFTEDEYNKMVQNGLKRKIKIIPDSDNNEIYLAPHTTGSKIKAQKLEGVFVLDLEDLKQAQKLVKLSRYGPLLLECEEYKAPVPVGVESSIIGLEIQKIKQEHPEARKFLICGFPLSINESIKFEDKVATVTKLFVPSTTDDPVADYFNTVKKTEVVNDVSDLVKAIS